MTRPRRARAAPRKKPDPPSIWIVAGANGSGKTTAYRELTIENPQGSVWIINPDVLALTIREREGLDPTPANLEAVKRIEKWLYASVDAYQTVGVETVLSSPKYRQLVDHAKRNAFRVRLAYVYLSSVELNIERVAKRVREGGHSVPTDKIIDRRRRSFEQLKWFFAAADDAFVFDNSGATPVLTAAKIDGAAQIYGKLIPEIQKAIG